MTLSPRRAASYRLSLRLLLSPARLRESLTTLQPQPSLRNATIAGAQVALALVLIAAALHPSPWQHVLGFACLGALAALFGRCATVAQRRRIVLIAGALLLGPVAVLSWLSWLGLPALALLLALAAITGVIAALAHRLQTGVPGAVIFIFAASAALSPVSSLQLLLERCIATALGVAVAWVLCLLTDRLRDISALPAHPGHPGGCRPRLGLPVRRPLVLDGAAGRRRAADLHRNDDRHELRPGADLRHPHGTANDHLGRSQRSRRHGAGAHPRHGPGGWCRHSAGPGVFVGARAHRAGPPPSADCVNSPPPNLASRTHAIHSGPKGTNKTKELKRAQKTSYNVALCWQSPAVPILVFRRGTTADPWLAGPIFPQTL